MKLGTKKLTKDQAIIVSAYTGILACNFDHVHEAIEKKLGRSVFTHEMGSKHFQEEVRIAFKEDFLEIVYDAN